MPPLQFRDGPTLRISVYRRIGFLSSVEHMFPFFPSLLRMRKGIAFSPGDCGPGCSRTESITGNRQCDRDVELQPLEGFLTAAKKLLRTRVRSG